MTTATVVICTYNRHDMLRRAVSSARGQILPSGLSAEILVVDNSRDANAQAVVAELAQGDGLALRYVSLPKPNISRARNAGVAQSHGDYVVFLDDDEWCAPGWLAGMITTAEQTSADLVFGAIEPVFPDGMPLWDPSGRSLARDMKLPSGSFISINHDPAISGLWIGTCNALLRRATCLDEPDTFDTALGVVGGEDYDLFLRLWQRGRRFAWSAEGKVWEDIPGNRITMAYRRSRAFITGQQYSAITIRRARSSALAALIVLIKGAIQVPLVAARWAWARRRGHSAADALELQLRMVAGKLFWWNLPLERG